MRIVPYDGDEDIEDIESLSMLIKAVPFEKGFVPIFTMIAPSEDYFLTIDELSCLMDGVEIASGRIDELIAMMLQAKITAAREQDIYDFELEDDDDNREDD